MSNPDRLQNFTNLYLAEVRAVEKHYSEKID